MQKIKLKQSLAFEDKMGRRGDEITVHSSVAKQLKDQGLVDFVGDETEEQPVSKSKENSVTFSDDKGKKIYDSGTTAKHVEEDKKKPSVTEVKKAKDPKEK